MTTYSLKTSAGDFDNIPDLMTELKSLFPLSDHVEVNVQGGASFGSAATPIMLNPPALSFGGKKITFKTADGDNTPGTILGPVYAQIGTSGGSNGVFEFYRLRCGARDDYQMFYNPDDYVAYQLRNCVICFRGSYGNTPTIIQAVIAGQLINNCSIFATDIDSPGSQYVVPISVGVGSIKNSLICGYRNDGGKAQIQFKGGVNNNNTIHDYYGSNIAEYALVFGATAPNLTIGNPNLAVDVIQAYDDTPETMLARSAKITALSSRLRGLADVSTAESVDIENNVR